jgi:hypothetical protein
MVKLDGLSLMPAIKWEDEFLINGLFAVWFIFD